MTIPINLDWPLWDRQKQCLLSGANEQLFGGASEGGKSYFSRVAINLVGMECEGVQMSLIRKKAADILSNHLEGDRGFRALLHPLSSKGLVEVTQKGVRFPKGNVCTFKHCQDERQFDSAQGNENQFLVIDEAPQISERLIRAFRSWARMTPEHLSRQPKFWQTKLPWVLYTGNPTGQSVGFFKRNFVKARERFAIEEVDGFRRQYVPSLASDNKSVDLRAHAARLAAIGDPALARALDLGDWDSPIGDAFEEFDEAKHVIPDHLPRPHLFRFRSFDWGTAEPFCCYWWYVSDGENFEDFHGKKLWLPKGALVAYREWYGCDEQEPSRGLRMRNEDIAVGILERSDETDRRVITLTDSLPFQDRGGKTIAETFAEHGVILTQSDTSRIPGWSQLRSRLIGIKVDSNDANRTPMIYFTQSCRYARDYIPAIPRHPTKPEDCVESGESTHACDAIRYACMARARIKFVPAMAPDTKNLKNDITFSQVIKKLEKIKRQSGRRY